MVVAAAAHDEGVQAGGGDAVAARLSVRPRNLRAAEVPARALPRGDRPEEYFLD